LFTMKKLYSKIAGGAVVALSALCVVSAAAAGNVTATANVTGAGALGLTLPSGPTLSSTLDGSDQTVVYTLPLSISDARGSGAGWNATVTSTSFTSGSNVLATTASSVTSVSQACVAGGTCTNATNAIAYPLTVPAAAIAPAAVKLFSAALNTGMGRFTITPSISVLIPGNAFAGAYTSTVTVAVATGP